MLQPGQAPSCTSAGWGASAWLLRGESLLQLSQRLCPRCRGTCSPSLPEALSLLSTAFLPPLLHANFETGA